MKKQKYALNNSYFKNRTQNDPDTPAEVVSHYREYGELPFRHDGGNWSYDMVCERQKRYGVQRCQYLTPDSLAKKMAEVAKRYADGRRIALDACCGTGQITKELLKLGFTVDAFDIDPDMAAVHQLLYPQCHAKVADFRDINTDIKWSLVVSNPPFDTAIARDFIEWLTNILTPGGRAVLLLPVGYMDKTRPKSLAKMLSRLIVLHRSQVTDKFVHTASSHGLFVVELADGYDD